MPASRPNFKSYYWLPFILLSLFLHFGGLQFFSRPSQQKTAETAQAQTQTGIVSVDFIEASMPSKHSNRAARPQASEAGPNTTMPDAASANGPQGVEGAKLQGSLLPQYPRAARERGESGVVELQLQITETGAIAQTEIAKSSGYARLDKAAIEAVQHAIFLPALENGKAVASSTQLRIHFQLNGTTALDP